jgi:hypothetical protein
MGKMYKYIRKFSDYDKREIVRRYAAGELLKTIATDFHTSPAVVSEIGITAGVLLSTFPVMFLLAISLPHGLAEIYILILHLDFHSNPISLE